MGRTIKVQPGQRATRRPAQAPPPPPTPGLQDPLVDPLAGGGMEPVDPGGDTAPKVMSDEERKHMIAASKTHLSKVFGYTESLMSSPTFDSLVSFRKMLARGLDGFADAAVGTPIEGSAKRITQVARRIESITAPVPAPQDVVEAAQKSGVAGNKAGRAWDKNNNAKGLGKLTSGISARVQQSRSDSAAKKFAKVKAVYDKQLLAAVPSFQDLHEDWQAVEGYVPGHGMIDVSLDSLRKNTAMALADPILKQIKDENFFIPDDVAQANSDSTYMELLTAKR